ncbi:LysR family transcriptional regulator [Paraburkholderia sp. UYCP14C]|uniref:LysR substrate-binding domain-containing protein n=1 Tax=Paraburkholderia sp. UYCP14C TaxID=2511130 RepID=UPI00101EEAE1|nr:LysR substrate-binding domain-containing protein [Paraburkholderia sp. UYCP14C]RZF29752.1 LysR family transcriptional regulator [Paraburkholderia sp. UYCP14C]
MRILPSLRALQCFEAVANYESFTKAANELCITHSAVSHQIRALEAWFGKDIFVRHSGGVRLTKEGERLKSACSVALALLEDECVGIRLRAPERKLTIGCSVSFLAHWLLPRIEEFSRRVPEVVLNFQARGDVAALLGREVDALIVTDRFPSSAIKATCLTTDMIGPVCAPNCSNLPRSPHDLGEMRLLHARSRMNAWSEWSQTVGVGVDSCCGQVLDSLSLTIEAARNGVGLAIAPELLVRRDLADGRLIAPMGFVRVERSTYLYVRASNSQEADIEIFRDWLLEECRKDLPLSA